MGLESFGDTTIITFGFPRPPPYGAGDGLALLVEALRRIIVIQFVLHRTTAYLLMTESYASCSGVLPCRLETEEPHAIDTAVCDDAVHIHATSNYLLTRTNKATKNDRDRF